MKAYLDGVFYEMDPLTGQPKLPDNPDNCWEVIQADIGVSDSEGVDTFTFYVCTLKKLQEILKVEKFQFGYHLILIEIFDWSIIENAIKSILNEIEADDWKELATKINEYGAWEFQDY